jgi:hypothetical protein
LPFVYSFSGYRSFGAALEADLVDDRTLERLHQRTRNEGAEIVALLIPAA